MRTIGNLARKEGLSGAVFTQLTDVENEVNGLLTYDRAKFKVPLETLAEINRTVFDGASN